MPVVVESDLDVVHLAALLVDRGEVLLAVLGPFDGTAELRRGEWDQQLVGIEEHDLRPEPPADVGCDDLDVGLLQAEQDREPAADRRRRLRRVVDQQLVFAPIPTRPDRAALHRGRGAALVAKSHPHPVWGGLQSGRDVPYLLHHLRRDIARHVVMHEVLGARPCLRRDHDGERVVLHLHPLGRVLRQRTGFGHDEGHRLAGVAHHLRGQTALGAAVGEAGMWDQQR